MRKEILLLLLCILSVQLVLAEDIEVSINEGDLLNLSNKISIYDPDGDVFTITYEDPLDDEGLWQTKHSDAGTYQTNITVADRKSTLIQTIKIIVEHTNREPIIDSFSPANLNITIDEKESIDFDVSAEDPDEDKLYYSWELDREEISAKSSFKLRTDYSSEGSHIIKLTISDGDLKIVKLWNVKVLHSNAPPEFEDLEDIEISETETIIIKPSAFDIDGDNISFTISEPVGDDGVWNTSFDDEGVYDITITASDGESETIKKIKVTVKDNERPPVLIYTEPEDKKVEIDEGEELTFEIKAKDPDNEEVTYSWKHNNKEVSNEQRFILKTDFNYAGAHTVEGFASDGSVSTSKEWLVIVKDVNRAPVIQNFDDIIIDENDSVVLTPNASDPDGDKFSIKFSKPLNDEGVWNTGFDDEGTYHITITASDGDLSSFKVVTIIVNNKDRLPIFNKINPIVVDEDDSVSFTPDVFDPDGDNVKISVKNLPEGAVFENNILSWTPNSSTVKRNTNWFGRLLKNLYLYNLFYKDEKKFKILFTAESKNSSSTQKLTIVVKDVNRPPVLSEINDIIIKETDTAKINVSATDPDQDHVKIKLSKPFSVRGEWFTDFNDEGVYNSSVSASDGDLVVTKNFQIIVEDNNRIPIIHFDEKIKIKEGETIKLEPEATDLDGDNISFTFSGWMTSDEYTTNEEDAGVHTVTVTASDGKDSESKDITIFVKDVKPKSALWFYLKYIILGLIILAIIIFLINLKERKEESKEKVKEKKEDKKTTWLWFKKEDKEIKEEVKKEAKKEIKVDKEIIVEERKESNFLEQLNNPEVKKWIGIILIILLLIALVSINFYLFKPSGKVKIADVDNQKIAENESLEILLEIKNADNFSVYYLPDGAKIKNSTISWTPDFEQSGSYTLVACGFNNISVDCTNISVAVENTNRAPELINFRPPERIMAYVDNPIIFFINATDKDNETLKYVWKRNGLFGEKIRSNSNALKITYKTIGKKTLSVKAFDGEEAFVEQKWIIDVIKRPPMTRLVPKTLTYNTQYIEFPEEGRTLSYVIGDEPSDEGIEVINDGLETIIKVEKPVDSFSYEITETSSEDSIEVKEPTKEPNSFILEEGDNSIKIVTEEEKITEFVLE